MANEFERDLTDLDGITIDEVERAGIHSIDELPMFRPTIKHNFSGQQQETLLEVADAVEAGEPVPESAVDPDLRAREPDFADPESIRKRLAGQAGTPSDEYEFKDEENALHTDLRRSSQPESRSEDDAVIFEAGEAEGLFAPEQVHIQGERKQKAQEYNQEERTEQERHVDEAYDAPTTTSYEQWKQNPDRLDFPGVDTVPQKKRQQRAAEFAANAQEQGLVNRFEIGTGVFGDERQGVRGNASGDSVMVDTSRAYDASSTLAHEVGHKVDEHIEERTTEGTVTEFGGLKDVDESVKQAATTLSTQLRGDPEGDDYRESGPELFADAVAASVLSPRRVERDAPEFVERLEETLDESERQLFSERLF